MSAVSGYKGSRKNSASKSRPIYIQSQFEKVQDKYMQSQGILNKEINKPIGQGAYGRVYVLLRTKQTLRNLENMFKLLRSRVLAANVNDGSGDIALKFQRFTRDAQPQFWKQSLREAQVHKYLTATQQTMITTASGCRLDNSIYPPLYFAGYWEEPALFVTAMAFVQGQTLKKVIASYPRLIGGIPASLFAKVEKMVVSSWIVGGIHGDLHDENILVTSSGDLKLIDFGFFIVLSKSVRAKVLEMVNEAVANGMKKHGVFADIADYLAPHFYRQMKKQRDYSHYNYDGKFLKILFARLNPSQRSKLAAERQKVWSCLSGSSRAKSSSGPVPMNINSLV
jgi:serine/threonine protein kinase